MRNLERQIGTVCRKVARQVAEGDGEGADEHHRAARCASCSGRASSPRRGGGPRSPGVATGLAWTPAGGDVLFIEAAAMPGSGRLTITGQLGEVMQESAQAALSYVRAHAGELVPGCPRTGSPSHDVHVHVPAGAVPKDGPCAGVTMATALASLITGRPVRARRRDDRRDHAHRPGAADRRPEGEVARRAARRDQRR